MKFKKIALLIVMTVAAFGFFIVIKNVQKPAGHNPVITEKNQGTVIKPDTKTPPSFNKTLYSNNDATSIWVVVNKTRPLQPLNYAPADLTTIAAGQFMRAEAAQALVSMITDAKKVSLVVVPLSGYRSYTTQVGVYNSEVKNNGKTVADTESARPGYSEHQTGLAVDFGGGGCGIEDCFGTTPEAKWLSNNAYKYGFILRYTPEKVAITGYRSEPWHFRYVGKLLSGQMHQDNVTTLEEFFGLPAAPTYP